MKRTGVGVVIGALACAAISGVAPRTTSTVSGSAVGPVIQIEDVDRFYKVYDAAGGHLTADRLQHDYIDPGSDGFHRFGKLRNISETTIAKTLAMHPEIDSGAKRCMVALPRVRQRLRGPSTAAVRRTRAVSSPGVIVRSPAARANASNAW